MNAINVYDFGAAGNGIADDTRAIQAAIDAAAQQGIAVHFLPGQYSVGELTLHEGSILTADPNWGFRFDECGTTVLLQRFEDQKCVLNLSNAYNCTINGLSLFGNRKPGECIGILDCKQAQGYKEDTFRIERTKVSGFYKDAVRFEHAWCFTIRQCMFSHSGGDGLHLNHSFDGFISDTWLSGNKGCGYGTSGENNAITMSGCRVEWNQNGGIVIRGGSHYQLTGNYIDRSGKQGIYITVGEDGGRLIYSNTVAVTGNIIYRSGKSAQNSEESCHIAVEKAAGVTVVGNTCCIGRDDRGVGVISPQIGMRMFGCQQCVMANNVLFAAATDTLLEQGNNQDTVVENNQGSLFDKQLEANTEVLPSTAAVTAAFEREEEI